MSEAQTTTVWTFRYHCYSGWLTFGLHVESDTEPTKPPEGFRPCYDCDDWGWAPLSEKEEK